MSMSFMGLGCPLEGPVWCPRADAAAQPLVAAHSDFSFALTSWAVQHWLDWLGNHSQPDVKQQVKKICFC